METLKLYTRDQILGLTSVRSGETKLGERVQAVSSLDQLALSNSKFVLLGLPEDIGIKANFGITGARTAWDGALRSLMNIQSTTKLRGDEITVLGHIDFENKLAKAESLNPENPDDLKALRELVSEIDEEVEAVIKVIYGAGKIPVIIGGGHNNGYPILKAFSKSFNAPVNAINLDAHSDFRPLEGRHSGNGFRYAFNEGFLNKYAVIGLHENYNSQTIIDEFKAQPRHFKYVFLEDFLRETTNYSRSFQDAMNFTEGLCGLEIDIDCIAGSLSSAQSPSGFSAEQVRDMIVQTTIRQLFYLHIAEGAHRLDDGRENKQTGKLIAFLISDFIKAQL
ncbi:MAG TPA: formimidoylglutamase [Daejeonella sp.]|nr:formimidoylglutamase [Daejeonella sp.]